MQYVKLTHKVLWELKAKGYNILTSVNAENKEDPTYMPAKIENVWDYLEGIPVMPMSNPELLVIDDALKNIQEEDLNGMVWVGED